MKLFVHILLALTIVGCASETSRAPAGPPAEGCHTPLGFIPEGRTATGYLHQIESRGQRCQQGTLSCDGGVWTGAYIYPSCVMSP
jgi:hypothetical protein